MRHHTTDLFQRYAGTSASHGLVSWIKRERCGPISAMRCDTMRCPPFCHYISARGIFLRTKRESHNKRTRWKTTVSPGVNWRFEARQDRYVPATATEISFPTRGRKRVSRFQPPRWLWQRGISILSGFNSFREIDAALRALPKRVSVRRELLRV